MPKCRQIVPFAKFDSFVKFAAFWIPPLLFSISNLCQNVVKSSLSPNLPFPSNSPLSGYPLSLAISNPRLYGKLLSNRPFRQIRHFRRICRFPVPHSFSPCLQPKFLWQNVVKSSLLPNSPLSGYPLIRSPSQIYAKMSSHRHLRQIRHFRRIHPFPDTSSFARCLKSKSLWQNVVKSSLSPNSPFSLNSPLSGYPLFRLLSLI